MAAEKVRIKSGSPFALMSSKAENTFIFYSQGLQEKKTKSNEKKFYHVFSFKCSLNRCNFLVWDYYFAYCKKITFTFLLLVPGFPNAEYKST